jgi:hypothetical protein
MRLPALIALASLLALGQAGAQNSTRKVRAEPSAQAARAGSAVRWRADLGAALAEAATSGRPVFWYVPTLRGSRMDRKPEIDRYMLAGPFSWPGLVDLLNARFVPVRQPAGRDEQQRYGVEPLRFVEPGFLVLGPDGSVLARIDEITTLCPDWFVERLAAPLGEAAGEDLAAARAWFDRLVALRDAGGGGTGAEARFVQGAVAFWSGREAEAVELWSRLAADLPEDPWSFKAAAEAEGHGPIVHGFEPPWSRLPEPVLAGPGPRGTTAPPGVRGEAELAAAALTFFRAMQRQDGGFVDSIYDFGGTDSLPNVHVAVTALAAWAMLEILSPRPRAEVADAEERCLGRAFDYATDDGNLNLEDRDELIWAYLYRARLCARWLDLRPEDAASVRPALEAAVRAIAGMQQEDGAWFHEYANPFVIAGCLVALAEAQRHGVPIPDTVPDRGVLALLKCRAEDGAISYGYSPRGRPRAQIAAGVGRMPLAETALSDWGHGIEGALERAVAASFEHHGELAQVRKYDDHASRLGYGGFFFWYDVHARGEAILRLEDPAARARAQAAQREQILALPEIDGCFVDSHELGRVYGTAMAWICLTSAQRR